jgi:hypothetical protein
VTIHATQGRFTCRLGFLPQKNIAGCAC